MDSLTEQDWLTSADAHAMLEYLYPVRGLHSTPVQPRKLRLYYLALARRWANSLPPIARTLIHFTELLADGMSATQDNLAEISAVAELLAESGGENCREKWLECERRLIARGVPILGGSSNWPEPWENRDLSHERTWPLVLALQQEVPSAKLLRRAQHDTDLLREIYSNPFNPCPLGEWRSADVVGMARKCYEDSDFRALPILADALQEAGCPEDHAVVQHCRYEGPHVHVRGCWAIDAILLR